MACESWLGQKSCRTKLSRIFRCFGPSFAPNFAPNFPRIFWGVFVLHFVGDGDQKKFTTNPRHFSMQNSQANSKKKSTIFFWRAVKVRVDCVRWTPAIGDWQFRPSKDLRLKKTRPSRFLLLRTIASDWFMVSSCLFGGHSPAKAWQSMRGTVRKLHKKIGVCNPQPFFCQLKLVFFLARCAPKLPKITWNCLKLPEIAW